MRLYTTIMLQVRL